MRQLVWFVLLGMGCGGGGAVDAGRAGVAVDAAPPPSAVAGNWFRAYNATCAEFFDFDSTVNYVHAAGCIEPNSPTTFDSEVTRGNYSFSGNLLIFRPTNTSCPTHSYDTTAFSVTYSKSGTSLVLGFTNALDVYQLNTAPAGGSGSLVYGCWDNGTFTTHDLVPVP